MQTIGEILEPTRKVAPRIIAGTTISIAILVAILYASVYSLQERLIYPGAGGGPAETYDGWREVALANTAAGAMVGYHLPAKPGKPTVMFLHGNGDGLRGSVFATQAFADRGYGVLVPEYPGYAGNPGKPDEDGLQAAAVNGRDWLAGRGVQDRDIVVIGNSIGTGPAIAAARRGASALVIVSGPASLLDVVQGHYPMIPAAMLRDHYDNEGAVRGIGIPVLVVHGSGDVLVPPEQGRRLAKASGGRLIMIEGGHGIAYDAETQELVLRWLENRRAVKQD